MKSLDELWAEYQSGVDFDPTHYVIVNCTIEKETELAVLAQHTATSTPVWIPKAVIYKLIPGLLHQDLCIEKVFLLREARYRSLGLRKEDVVL